MQRIKLFIIIAFISCSPKETEFTMTGDLSFPEQLTALKNSRLSDGDKMDQLYQIYWDYAMREYPESATFTGYPGQDDRLTDMSLDAINRREQDTHEAAQFMESIDRANLTETGKLNFDLLKRDVDLELDGFRFDEDYLLINQMGGVQQDIAQLIAAMPAAKTEHFENILARLNALPVLIDQTIALLNKGLEADVTPPKITLRNVPQQVLNQIPDNAMDAPLLQPFNTIPSSISESVRERLKNDAEQVYRQKIVPAFQNLHTYLTETYIPGARESIGMSDMPNGREWYAFRARLYTTTDMTPDEIHETGLSEVKRIRAEMDNIIKESGFSGTFDEFTEFLRTDPRFYFPDKESLLKSYRDITKKADPELVKLFGKLPRLPYGVVPVPSYAEKSQTTAYYLPGSPEAGRPGYFFANTYYLKTRPSWEMEALSLHEAVPGHHLQIALAQELENVPEFRKYGTSTAFVEGWGLYSESLGEELGFYSDPYSKFGQLTYEIWRAIRLVVDTGMHYKGWTRQQAIEYFIENTGKSEHDIVVEIDRYIVWPGQALAYKIGQLKIRELRTYAENELGDKFDVRSFHDNVLGNGAIPLGILETTIKQWVANQKDG